MNIESIRQPLVSIVVITYNSSKFVLETLESAKAQTYQNVEIIVSDDCSTDDTIAICKKWLEENKNRFQRTELISVLTNTGIPSNCNRGVKATKGDWVKLIAGDDILLENCVDDNILFVTKRDDVKILLSNVIIFGNGIASHKTARIAKPFRKELLEEFCDSRKQHKSLIFNYFNNSTSLFIAKIVYNDVIYDERFKYIEDYPFALNATKYGYCFGYLDKETVMYRISDNSVCGSKNDKNIFTDFYAKRHSFDIIYRFPYLPKKVRKSEMYEYRMKRFFDKLNLNRNQFFFKVMYKITYLLNPYKPIGFYLMRLKIYIRNVLR